MQNIFWTRTGGRHMYRVPPRAHWGSGNTIITFAAKICFKISIDFDILTWEWFRRGSSSSSTPPLVYKVEAVFVLEPRKQSRRRLATHSGEHTKDDIGPLSAEWRRTAFFLVNSSRALPPRYLQLNARSAIRTVNIDYSDRVCSPTSVAS